ncbi:MAG TPA: DsbA family protein [Longimicrobiaceae bacterium]|nr:DsbA family protein [Longimicrobiaceae bacterium]
MARTPPPPQRNPLIPFYVILGLVALVGVGLLARSLSRHRGGTAATEPVPVNVSPEEIARTPGIPMGSADAPVTILEFADFQCPHCAEWATFIEPLIREKLIKPGIVRYVYHEFPLGGAFRHSFLAARAGRCANEQGKFWPYHDLLFARQPDWTGLDDPTDFFIDLAGQAGLDKGPFEQCLESDKYADIVSRNRALGVQLGVQGTPTLFINGKRIEQLPSDFTTLEAIVMREAGRAPAADSAADSASAPADTGQ